MSTFDLGFVSDSDVGDQDNQDEQVIGDQDNRGKEGGSETSRRLEERHLDIDIDDYLDKAQSVETKKATSSAISIFNKVTKEISKRRKVPFVPLEEIKKEDLRDALCQFFILARKENGEVSLVFKQLISPLPTLN